MPMHQLFVLLSIVFFFLAAATSWPRSTNPAIGWSLVLGWAGAFSFAVSTIVG